MIRTCGIVACRCFIWAIPRPCWRDVRILAINDSSDDFHAVWTVELEERLKRPSLQRTAPDGGVDRAGRLSML